MCHSDIDHMHGIVHTPWGGAYPSIPGHEIVGRIEALAAGTGVDAASGSTSTVTQGMQMARRGGTVVIGGLALRMAD
jgi:D-arabinose 1-dehydrogenase-like Zn-dependent alcohol dehydrogenase